MLKQQQYFIFILDNIISKPSIQNNGMDKNKDFRRHILLIFDLYQSFFFIYKCRKEKKLFCLIRNRKSNSMPLSVKVKHLTSLILALSLSLWLFDLFTDNSILAYLVSSFKSFLSLKKFIIYCISIFCSLYYV